MQIGRFSIEKRYCRTKDFKWFYSPLAESIGREQYYFYWWFGHDWCISFKKW